MIKYSTIFRKTRNMVYISHLDLMTLFRRAIRRAGLPFVLTGGFTPRVKISMPKALKVGQESEREEMSLWLTAEKAEEDITAAINKQLPNGIEIFEVKRVNR